MRNIFTVHTGLPHLWCITDIMTRSRTIGLPINRHNVIQTIIAVGMMIGERATGKTIGLATTLTMEDTLVLDVMIVVSQPEGHLQRKMIPSIETEARLTLAMGLQVHRTT